MKEICYPCMGIENMTAKTPNAGVLSPESTQQLEETLGLESGQFGFKTLTRYDGANRAWSVTLVIKEKATKQLTSVDLGTL